MGRVLSWLMGYIIAVVVLLLFLAALFGFRRPRRPGAGQGHLPSDHPVSRTEPAADEPTPGASRTSTPAKVQRAQDRVPPA